MREDITIPGFDRLRTSTWISLSQALDTQGAPLHVGLSIMQTAPETLLLVGDHPAIRSGAKELPGPVRLITQAGARVTHPLS